jgi:hypothetical protein
MLQHFLPSLPLDQRSKLIVFQVNAIVEIAEPELSSADSGTENVQ